MFGDVIDYLSQEFGDYEGACKFDLEIIILSIKYVKFVNPRAGAMSLNPVVPKETGSIASKFRNLVVPLHPSQKSSGSMEPLEPPLTPALQAIGMSHFEYLIS